MCCLFVRSSHAPLCALLSLSWQTLLPQCLARGGWSRSVEIGPIWFWSSLVWLVWLVWLVGLVWFGWFGLSLVNVKLAS